MFKVANAKIPRWVSFDSLDRQELQYQHQKWILTTLIAHFYTVQCLIDYLTIFFRCCNNDAVTSWRQPILISKATMKWTNAKIFKGPYCISWVVETSCLGFPFLSEKSSGKWWYDGRQNKRQLNNNLFYDFFGLGIEPQQVLKVLTIQGVDWYPSWHFGIGNLEHVKWWQVFHQIEKKIKTNQSCSISKRDHIKISSLLFSITLPTLFTFLTFLELFFRF